MAFYTNTTRDEEKEAILAEACSTEEGRAALAAAMEVVPIRCGGMGYYDNIAYISFGGYEYPERALRAAEKIGKGQSFMAAYREINDSYASHPDLLEPIGHYDWLKNRDNPDYFHVYSLWDTKRAIRDYLEADALPCLNIETDFCVDDRLCANCLRRKTARALLERAAALPQTNHEPMLPPIGEE